MEKTTTQRGFTLNTFLDRDGHEITVQASSIATENLIWVGMKKPDIIVFNKENKGIYSVIQCPENWTVDCRMHISQKQALELSKILLKFSETGEL